ncbi:zinc dependent phospholipase C family protein [Clostridium sp. YIM B02515]|uniref:Zinc dependent phospholipase C family protein n=1 Tax=Clostridium rhizosphaerae TaxID=2803861 RepID=A0ABS1TBB8_9CLOT|nr:zinc dependent phospholipase C family protein [Clostridium rhizosphaerae]MBL4936630.1 zinc dependent phospholipase C family protein [Clostridium rhizosphaerae]
MITSSHILIANLVYKYILKSTNFILDLPAFSYGNIRPDLDKGYIKCEHTLEDSLEMINIYSEDIINSNISVKDFSMALGIICHFVSDYFCIYHTKEYWKKDKLGHGTYEVTLHTKLLSMFLTGSIDLRYKCKKEVSIKNLILKIRKKYYLEPQGIMTDINYSLIAASSVCEFIVKSSKVYQRYKIE